MKMKESGPEGTFRRPLAAAICFFGAVALSACTVREDSAENQSENVQAPALARTYAPVTGPNTPLVLKFSARGDPASPIIQGVTNLPDGTLIQGNVLQGDRYMTDGFQVAVANGAFAGGPLKLNGDPLVPGNYKLIVTTPLEVVQPESVRAAVGREYENLTGEGFEDSNVGRIVTINQPHLVPGARDRTAETRRDEKRQREVHAFYERSCADVERRAGRPTLTPKARERIALCVRQFEASK